MTTNTIVTQVGRALRLGAVTFLAQVFAQGNTVHIKQVIPVAAVAALEVVYRQLVPTFSTTEVFQEIDRFFTEHVLPIIHQANAAKPAQAEAKSVQAEAPKTTETK
jgi:hypothetical protein